MKKIIVAGAGHGGLAAAALLSKDGYDVTVFEKNARNGLGYDWTDIFAPGALGIASVPMPEKDKFTYKDNMTFYSPNCKKGLVQNVPEDQLEIKMERKDIYDLLVSNAEKAGVKFVFECAVKRPLKRKAALFHVFMFSAHFITRLVMSRQRMFIKYICFRRASLESAGLQARKSSPMF